MCLPLRLSSASASTSVTFSPSKHGSRSRRAFNRSFLSLSTSVHRHGGSLTAGVCMGSDINIFLSVSKSDTERERERLWVSKNKYRYHKKDSSCFSSMARRKFSVKKPKIINIATQEGKRQDPYMNISPTSSSLFAPFLDVSLLLLTLTCLTRQRSSRRTRTGSMQIDLYKDLFEIYCDILG